MTAYKLKSEFKTLNFEDSKQEQEQKVPELIKPSTGLCQGISSIYKTSNDLTEIGQSFDAKS